MLHGLIDNRPANPLCSTTYPYINRLVPYSFNITPSSPFQHHSSSLFTISSVHSGLLK